MQKSIKSGAAPAAPSASAAQMKSTYDQRIADAVNEAVNGPPKKTSFVNISDNNGLTPLYAASSEGHVEIVKSLLLYKNTDVNLANNQGWSPLHGTVKNGHEDVIDLLLTNGRDININCEDIQGNTPLHIAAGNNRYKITAKLLADCRIVSDAPNKAGLTPLDIAIAMGFESIVHLLHVHSRNTICAYMSCSKPNPSNLCTKCMRVCYCDVKCQHDHWSEHKKECSRKVSVATANEIMKVTADAPKASKLDSSCK